MVSGMVLNNEIVSENINQILARMEKDSNHSEVMLILANCLQYINRIGGGESKVVRGHPLFDANLVPISQELASELENRISDLAEFQLTSSAKVQSYLLNGLRPSKPIRFTKRQIALLLEIAQHPTYRIQHLVQQLRTSARTIRKELTWLKEQLGFHIAYQLNPHQFHLKHFVVYFRTKSLKATRNLETKLFETQKNLEQWPLFLGYGFDVTQREGFFATYIPNQERTKQNFQHTLKNLKEKYMEKSQSFQINGFSAELNFDCFDFTTQEWKIEADLQTEGSLQFFKEHGYPFYRFHKIAYSDNSSSFDQVDWMLTLLLANGRFSRAERKAIINEYGFPLASKTIWAREHQLRIKGLIHPYPAFSPLIFEDIIGIFVKSNPFAIDLIKRLSFQFPYAQIFLAGDGAIAFIATPISGPSLATQLTRSLLQLNDLKEFNVLRFKRNYCFVPTLRSYKFWNRHLGIWQTD
jgi:hypothetical protein